MSPAPKKLKHYNALMYLAVLVVVVVIGIAVPDKEGIVKNPYKESIALKEKIDSTLGVHGLDLSSVNESASEKVVNDHRILFTSYHISLEEEELFYNLIKDLKSRLSETGEIFSESEYELNSQRTVTFYSGFDSYICCFIAISFYRETEPDSHQPVVAIIIDDMGNDIGRRFKTLLKLDGLTFSVLPNCRNSKYTAVEGYKNGHEIMMHCPMEPINSNLIPANDKTMLLANMNLKEIEKRLINNLNDIPNAVGVNNHMGSRFTQDKKRTKKVMKILKNKNMYYVDSLTIQNSQAWKSASEINLPYLKRDIFLDHKNDKQYIKNQISKLIKRAYKQGYAVAIGHIRGVTPETLEEAYPEFNALGIKVVPVSYIIENREVLSRNGDLEITEEVEEIINEYRDH